MGRLKGWNWVSLTLLLPLISVDSSNISDALFVAMSAPIDMLFPRNVRCTHQKSTSLVCAIQCKEVGWLLLSVDDDNCFLCTLSSDASTDITILGQVYILDHKALLGKMTSLSINHRRNGQEVKLNISLVVFLCFVCL